MNILTFSTHEGYQYNLCKTGHQFDILESGKLGGVIGWDYRQRPLPDNAHIISSVDNYDKYDLILCQKIPDWSAVKHIQKKKIILFHVTWSRNWDIAEDIDFKSRDEFMSTMNEHYKVFVLDSKRQTWGGNDEKSVVINHGVDLKDYDQEYTGNIKSVLRACHYFRERDAWCGHNKFIKILNGLPYLVLGNNPGMNNSVYPNCFNMYKKYFSSHRLYFNSTAGAYPFCMLDAMASGMPVVSTEMKKEKKYIENGINGFVSDDEEFLHQSILSLFENEKKAKQIGKNGRDIINDHFNINVFVNKWNEIFELARS